LFNHTKPNILRKVRKNILRRTRMMMMMMMMRRRMMMMMRRRMISFLSKRARGGFERPQKKSFSHSTTTPFI